MTALLGCEYKDEMGDDSYLEIWRHEMTIVDSCLADLNIYPDVVNLIMNAVALHCPPKMFYFSRVIEHAIFTESETLLHLAKEWDHCTHDMIIGNSKYLKQLLIITEGAENIGKCQSISI